MSLYTMYIATKIWYIWTTSCVALTPCVHHSFLNLQDIWAGCLDPPPLQHTLLINTPSVHLWSTESHPIDHHIVYIGNFTFDAPVSLMRLCTIFWLFLWNDNIYYFYSKIWKSNKNNTSFLYYPYPKLIS